MGHRRLCILKSSLDSPIVDRKHANDAWCKPDAHCVSDSTFQGTAGVVLIERTTSCAAYSTTDGDLSHHLRVVLGAQTYMAGLQLLCEFAITIVHNHSALGAAGFDGLDGLFYDVNAERWPEGISAGPLNKRHTCVYRSTLILQDSCVMTLMHHLSSLIAQTAVARHALWYVVCLVLGEFCTLTP